MFAVPPIEDVSASLSLRSKKSSNVQNSEPHSLIDSQVENKNSLILILTLFGDWVEITWIRTLNLHFLSILISSGPL